MKHLLLTLSALCLILLASCTKDDPKPPVTHTEQLILTLSPDSIVPGQQAHISILYLLDGDTVKIDPSLLKLQVADTAVARIQGDSILALSPGSTTVTATYKEETATATLRIGKRTIDLQSVPGFPFLKFGASEEEVREFETARGNEIFTSGQVQGEPNMTYLSVAGKQLETHKYYEYFFTDGAMDEVQTYTTLYEQFWSLEEGGKPTQAALDYFEDLGFKFYGYDNSVGYPTCVCWNKEHKLMLAFGPRFRFGITTLMFNIFVVEDEPSVDDTEEYPVAHLKTDKAIGEDMSISIASNHEFQIDWGNGTKINYPAGEYINDRMLRNKITGQSIYIYGQGITLLECSAQKISLVEFDDMPNLTELRLLTNNLKSIDLSTLPNLQLLNVSYNQLTKINAKNNVRLREIHCFRNSITSLSLPASLELLYAHRNELSSIDLSGNWQLQNLVLSHNKLTRLDLSNNTRLVELQVAYNSLNSLKMPLQPKALLTVFVNSNQLQTSILDELIDRLPNVSSIHVSDEENSWKCRLNITNNPGTADANGKKASDKGWRM